MLDWNDFRIFLAIRREGTLSAAARSLKLDQSTIGRRLAALEAAANARLFDRTPEGYVLTAAGEAVLANVEEIETRALSVEQELLGHDARLQGTVRLATSDSLAAWLLVPRLQVLRRKHPGVVVVLVTGNRPADLGRREADLSVRLSKPTDASLVARRLARAPWALYASESYLAEQVRPEPGNGLQGHDVIGFDDELSGTAGARWLRENGARARTVLSSNSLVSYASAVTAGLGMGPLPCLFGDAQPNLVRVLPGTIGYHDIWLVVHPNVKSSARVRAVMEELASLIEREAPLIGGERARSGARAAEPRRRSKRRAR